MATDERFPARSNEGLGGGAGPDRPLQQRERLCARPDPARPGAGCKPRRDAEAHPEGIESGISTRSMEDILRAARARAAGKPNDDV